MKIKIIDEECVNHIGYGTCCNYDLKNIIFDAVDEGNIGFPIKVLFPDGEHCYFDRNEIEIIEE